jgi:hypothetical protein
MFNPDAALYVTLKGREVAAVARILFQNIVLDHKILLFDAKSMFYPSPKTPRLIPENEGPRTDT